MLLLYLLSMTDKIYAWALLLYFSLTLQEQKMVNAEEFKAQFHNSSLTDHERIKL